MTASSFVPVGSKDVPQANVLRRVLVLVEHIAKQEDPRQSFTDPRDSNYYERAARILGLIDEGGAVTPIALAIVAMEAARRIPALAERFAASPCGRAWLAWAGVSSLDELEPSSAARFLAACSSLKDKTIRRRALTLQRWAETFRGIASRGRARKPKSPRDDRARPPSASPQLSFADLPPPPLPGGDAQRTAGGAWPDPLRFPHNEDGAEVFPIVDGDFERSDHVLIVTGYASLDKVVDFLAVRSQRPGPQELRIIFGNEPFKPRSSWEALSVKPLADEIRDYWLERGISVLLSAAVLQARELVIQGLVQVRTGRRRRRLHAKIYVAAETAVLGSSNFTEPGLRKQSEANVRFDATERTRLEEARQLAEGLWNAGEDYCDGFLKLLDALLRAVTWQEALARACASVLDGDWARSYLPAEDLGRLERDLWPHQVQGTRQALWILENVSQVELTQRMASYGFTEKQYVSRVVRNAPRLSSHFIFDCLRPSRAARFEHVYGTDPALAHFRLGGVLERKAPTGNVIRGRSPPSAVCGAWPPAGSFSPMQQRIQSPTLRRLRGTCEIASAAIHRAS